ncbi:MAG TPA: GGDEF domain-containing protein [Anaeromyxobacteraceae bacterium]|nr:GGDEF domain-containing protein [Anaeromyxobacteraceae bacterium]
MSAPGALAISLALVLCVAFGDDLTGPEVSFTVLYLGPIGFATWFAGLGAGAALSVIAAMAATLSDVVSRSTPLAHAIQVWNLSVQLSVFLALAFLLHALKTRLEAEQMLARTDPLTLLSNRRAFVESAAIELERSRRTRQPITVAYVDVDDFKHVNDLLGHNEGDALLSAVAATLRGGTRAVDAVARLGGDEFGLLLVDTDEDTATALLERLRAALLAVVRESGWHVTFSVGAVTFVTPPFSVDEMIGRADQLMYDKKRRGKNGIRHVVVHRAPHLVVPEQRVQM